MNWERRELREIITLNYGASLAARDRNPGAIRVYGSNGEIGEHDVALVQGPGVIVGRKGSVGEVHFSESPFWPIDTTYWIGRVRDDDWRFLYFLLSYLNLRTLNSHSTIPGLNRESAYAMIADIPPVDEQRRIAAILWKVQRAIEVQERLVATVRELKQAAMRQLFTRGLRGEAQKETEIGSVPESWEVVLLGQLGRIGNGSTPKRDNERFWREGTTPWLNSGKIHEGVIESADQFVTNAAIAECHLPVVPAGSLLVAITGQGKTLGNVARVTFDTTVNQHLAYLRFDSEGVEADFIRYYLASRYDVLRAIGSAGGSTKGAITCAELKHFRVPRLSSLAEQHEIATALQTIDRKLSHHERKRDVLQELFRTLLHELMTGRIRVHELDIDLSELAAGTTGGEAK